MQVLGFEVDTVNSVQFSNHTAQQVTVERSSVLWFHSCFQDIGHNCNFRVLWKIHRFGIST
uniref:MHC class II antigen n=1 Tax=Pavo cristatus TaxID=9049 RepID=A0A8C9FMF6_PAVCR